MCFSNCMHFILNSFNELADSLFQSQRCKSIYTAILIQVHVTGNGSLYANIRAAPYVRSSWNTTCGVNVYPSQLSAVEGFQEITECH